MVLSIVHWLISSPFSSKAVQFFTAEFSPEEGVTFLIKGNGKRVAAIM